MSLKRIDIFLGVFNLPVTRSDYSYDEYVMTTDVYFKNVIVAFFTFVTTNYICACDHADPCGNFGFWIYCGLSLV